MPDRASPRRIFPIADRIKQTTLNDVASDAGVSYQTVSRVINDHPHVADSTRKRVQASIEKLGYRPNRVARSLVTNRTHTVGIVAYGSTFYGPSQMVVNIDRSLKERGYGLTMTTIRELTFQDLRDAVEELHSRSVDGLVLIAPIHGIDVEDIQSLCASTPFVIVGVPPGVSTPSIVIDQRKGGAMATTHLIELGHHQIAAIHGPLTWNDARLRHEAHERVLSEAGLEPGPSIESDWTSLGGYRALHEIMESNRDFTGLVVGNDQMALGAIRGLTERGISVPQDLSIVGFDDVPEAAFFNPPLTTIRQDFEALGQQSAEYLIALMEDPETRISQEFLGPTLVVRSSTQPFRTSAVDTATSTPVSVTANDLHRN